MRQRRTARRRTATRISALGLSLLVAASGVAAQDAPEVAPAATAAAEAPPTAPEQIAERRKTLASELASTDGRLAKAEGEELRAHLEDVRARLRAIDALLEEQSVLKAPTEKPTETPGEEVDAEPSIFALNRLYEARFALEQREAQDREALDESREALAAAKQKLEEAETRRREARRALEAAAGQKERLRATRALELRELASRTARERVHVRTLETRGAERRSELDASQEALSESIARMTAAISRGEARSASGFQTLAQREAELREERHAIERRLARVELQLVANRERFTRLPASDDLLEEIDGLAGAQDTLQREAALVDARLARLASQRNLWRQWEAVLGPEVPDEKLESWKQDTAERIEALEQVQLDRMGQRSEVERRLASLEARLFAVSPTADRAAHEAQRASLVRLLEAERIEAGEVARDMRLSERLLAALRERTGDIDGWGYAARGGESLREAWRYEITAVDDAPITVGSVFLALVFAIAGFWASRRASALVGRAAERRLRLDAGSAHTLQTLCFYVLLVVFLLLALRAIHFPLTAFTVLGGALAIGIGFGSQNVMNNFISGLILLLERPVRARDVVEVDGNHGTIEKIGARSTQIRSTDGRHIIVPNSFFLESNVVNWTLSDDLVRTKVSVGVTYGSPTGLVEELIGRVAAEEDAIIRNPEPIVLFEEFGDNSLNFSVHFWVRARSPMQMRKVESRVRFRIDQLFREHDLVIAFPQRDVHLDSASAIEVRMVRSDRDDNQEPE